MSPLPCKKGKGRAIEWSPVEDLSSAEETQDNTKGNCEKVLPTRCKYGLLPPTPFVKQ